MPSPSTPESTSSWTTNYFWIAGNNRFPNPQSSRTLKDLFLFTTAHNLSLSLHYVPSHLNPADQPSQVLSDLDCTLSQDRWKRIDTTFGPHTIDLTALPSNVRHNRSGNPLPFFSLFPCPQSAGTNVFAQSIARQENAYVFPPFLLIGPLIRFSESQSCTFTIMVPDNSRRKYRWPLVFCRASCAYKLASKGDNNVLLFPTKSGSSPWVPRPLQWDLWLMNYVNLIFLVFGVSATSRSTSRMETSCAVPRLLIS